MSDQAPSYRCFVYELPLHVAMTKAASGQMPFRDFLQACVDAEGDTLSCLKYLLVNNWLAADNSKDQR